MKTQLVVRAELRSFKLQESRFPFMLLHPAITGAQWKELLGNAWMISFKERPLLITGFDWEEERIIQKFGLCLQKKRVGRYKIIEMDILTLNSIEGVVEIVRHPIPQPSLD